MRGRQLASVVACVAMVAAAYVTWDVAVGGFNPNPPPLRLDIVSCSPATPPCPAFRIDSANLSVIVQTDHTYQLLSIRVTALGPSKVSALRAYFDNHSIGESDAGQLPGTSATSSWPIPTSLNVTRGESYQVYLESEYIGAAAAGPVSEYWELVEVVAS